MPGQNLHPLHKNNFDFLRIVFACLVVVSHSVSLSGLQSKNTFINHYSDYLAKAGVYGFFVISGYLVSWSLERTLSIQRFIKKRLLRIFPAMIVMALFVCFILGGIFTVLPRTGYYSNASTYLNFISTILLIPVHKCLPGLFENNSTGCATNGSLWTIRYELLFYAVLVFYYWVKQRKRKNASIVLWTISLIGLILWNFYFKNKLSEQLNYHADRIFHLSYLFFSGVLFKYVPIVTKHNHRSIFFAALIIETVCINFHHLSFVTDIFFPLLVISAGLYYSPQLKINPRLGDISYGIYIYAYPLQQLLSERKCTSNIYIFILYSLLLSMAFGFMSWHLVEKKFLRKERAAHNEI